MPLRIRRGAVERGAAAQLNWLFNSTNAPTRHNIIATVSLHPNSPGSCGKMCLEHISCPPHKSQAAKNIYFGSQKSKSISSVRFPLSCQGHELGFSFFCRQNAVTTLVLHAAMFQITRRGLSNPFMVRFSTLMRKQNAYNMQSVNQHESLRCSALFKRPSSSQRPVETHW